MGSIMVEVSATLPGIVDSSPGYDHVSIHANIHVTFSGPESDRKYLVLKEFSQSSLKIYYADLLVKYFHCRHLLKSIFFY
jgi:hypothetical protein